MGRRPRRPTIGIFKNYALLKPIFCRGRRPRHPKIGIFKNYALLKPIFCRGGVLDVPQLVYSKITLD